ncbi:peroxisomal biogenesis factor 19 isoform X1 [Manacus candei]|uniref:peroxisomal biogenesis factor 19 isoform X1 n=1 Tax=Manacus candei TaxID=415023 RepID=UPI0022270201|nr:peroxisomal biogenesis factor 19 isoform X1 [Manacus candei]
MAAEPEPGPGPDPELEELLDSALDDFERSRPSPAPPPPPSSSSLPSPSAADAAKASLFSSQERFFQELFEGELASQAAAEFEEAMRELARQEPQLVQHFQRLSEAAGRVGPDAASQQEFTSCLKETLSGLAKNATDLQSGPGSEEELAQALEGLAVEEGAADGGVLPVMRSLMQALLSKDVLYPSLRDITDKYPEWLRQHGGSLGRFGGPWGGLGVPPDPGTPQYPEWLRQHGGSLPPEQRERFRAQHSLMSRLCAELERERPGEPEGQRRQRFETLLDLMQQLQELGHPPKELAGDTPPGWNLELPGGAGGEQCRLM